MACHASCTPLKIGNIARQALLGAPSELLQTDFVLITVGVLAISPNLTFTNLFGESSENPNSVRSIFGFKPRSNDRNMPTQHVATLLGAICCAQHCCDMLRWNVAIVWPGL